MYSVLVAQPQHNPLHDHSQSNAGLTKARVLIGKVRALLTVLGHH